jgi:nucleotide-binding universal stress UspA family protein
MFEKVLVPTDFSKYSREVIKCVGELPGLREVIILNVVARDPLARTWDPVAEARDAEKRAADEAKSIESPGISIRARGISALDGEVADAINRVADEENADLIMMGARGRSIIESAILGSTSRGVLQYGDRDLLLMRYKLLDTMEKGTYEKYCARIFSKVLVPTDLSEPSEAMLSILRNILGIGEIILLHVISRGETKEEIDGETSRATETLNEIASKIREANVTVTPKVVVGNSIEQIRKVADAEDVSLIAMSAQGRAALRKGRIGSTAYDVANKASRPVLIIRADMPISG